MRFRTFINIVVAVVIALLVVGAGGFTWIVAQTPRPQSLNSRQASPSAAVFVSRDAPVVASLLVSPADLESFRLASLPLSQQRRVRADFTQLKRSLRQRTGLRYGDDIAPWVGDEVTFAITAPDWDRAAANGNQPGYLVAAAIADAAIARTCLEQFWQRQIGRGEELQVEQVAGVPVTTVAGKTALTTALVGDRFVLFGNAPSVVREAINNAQVTDLSLAASPSYAAILESLPSRQLGMAIVNLPYLLAQLGETATPQPLQLGQQAYETWITSLRFDAPNLLANVSLLPPQGTQLAPEPPALDDPVAALHYGSPNSAFVAASQDLQSLWSHLQAAAAEPLTPFVTAPVEGFLQDNWNLNLVEAIAPWIREDYALAALPDGDRTDWVLVTRSSPEAVAAVENFDEEAQAQGYSVGALPLGDQATTLWTQLAAVVADAKSTVPGFRTLSAEVKGIHTTVDDYLLLSTAVSALDQALQAPQSSIIDGPPLKRAIARLERPNNGYIYARRDILENWLATLPNLKQRLEGINPLLDQVQSVTLSNYGNDETAKRSGLYIELVTE
ncbi:MAG: DUF3352 domain-containing protein [Synechococcales bacterium]|nr:DUF3352 domain-containing protein [Synechococcales bacterium]